MARRSKRFWVTFVLIVLILAGLVTFNYWPVHEKIIISPQTTVIDGPVNPDGTINYATYLDAKCAEGVTPENNAASLLVKAAGPDRLPASGRGATLRVLGLADSDMGNGKHLVDWNDRASRTPATEPERDGWGRTREKTVNDICDAILGGEAKSDPEFNAWVAENAVALQLVREASSRPRLYMPLDTPCAAPGAKVFGLAGEAIHARALLRLQGGDFDGGWADVMAFHRLARLLGQSPTLISRIMAARADIAASRAGIYALATATLPADKLSRALDDLGSLRQLADMAETLDVGERLNVLDIAMTLVRGTDPRAMQGEGSKFVSFALKSSLDCNEMLRELNRWCDRLVQTVRTSRFDASGGEARDAEIRRLEVSLRDGGESVLTATTFMGRAGRKAATRRTAAVMMRLLTPTLAGCVGVEDEARMSLEVERTAAALALYKARHGRYPASLRELCPELLKEVPKDVFSPRGELVYRANDNAYIVYSVGRNLRDDGGVSDTATGKDDIVAKVGDVDSSTTLPASRPER